MLLRTGLSIRVQFGEFRAEDTFMLIAWQPVSVALLNPVVDAEDGNSACDSTLPARYRFGPPRSNRLSKRELLVASFAPMSVNRCVDRPW